MHAHACEKRDTGQHMRACPNQCNPGFIARCGVTGIFDGWCWTFDSSDDIIVELIHPHVCEESVHGHWSLSIQYVDVAALFPLP